MQLKREYELTLFYYNPNIAPYSEYCKRRDDVFYFAEKNGIDFLEADYDYRRWLDVIKPYWKTGEKGYRCFLCYEIRMMRTAIEAKKRKYELFGTILSVSPYKFSKWILNLGVYLSAKYGIDFLYRDFKKQGGYKKAIDFAKENGFYIQNYCGCPYSKYERKKKELYLSKHNK